MFSNSYSKIKLTYIIKLYYLNVFKITYSVPFFPIKEEEEQRSDNNIKVSSN